MEIRIRLRKDSARIIPVFVRKTIWQIFVLGRLGGGHTFGLPILCCESLRKVPPLWLRKYFAENSRYDTGPYWSAIMFISKLSSRDGDSSGTA
jgi:hypothetical protein